MLQRALFVLWAVLLPVMAFAQTTPAETQKTSSWGAIKALYRGTASPAESTSSSWAGRIDKMEAGTAASSPSWCWNWKFPFCGSWQISCKYNCYLHTGQDSYAVDWNLPGDSDRGQLVVAPASGWQVWSGPHGGYGNSVVVFTGTSTYYRLAHMDWLAYPYQTRYVYQGQILGTCGSTGGNYSPHIHFSVHYPATYLGGGRISGPSVPQEGISNKWTLNTWSYYSSEQYCQSR